MTRPAKLADGTVLEPLRVVIVGGSVSVMVVPARRDISEGNYGEVLVRMLHEDGIRAEVAHQGKWFDMIHELRRRYEFAVRNRFPHVLVLNYGMGEAQAHMLPTWMARHFASWDVSTHPVARAYRSRVAPRLWRQVRRWQQWSSGRVALRTWRLSPERFRLDMQHVIEMAREETGCLVLVVDCDPPGERFEHWLPGLYQRWEVFQRVLQELVDGFDDPMVRLVPASRTLTDLSADLPDGIHRTAQTHRLTAELLRDEILQWLDEPVKDEDR